MVTKRYNWEKHHNIIHRKLSASYGSSLYMEPFILRLVDNSYTFTKNLSNNVAIYGCLSSVMRIKYDVCNKIT